MTGRFGPDAEVDVAKSYGRFVPLRGRLSALFNANIYWLS